MKLTDRTIASLELLPIFLMVWSAMCFILSFNLEFYDWFRDLSAKTIECPLLFVFVLWAMACYYEWRVMSKACIVYLLGISVADLIYMVNNDLNEYGMWFTLSAGCVAVVYALCEITNKE